jgi:integrase
MVTTKKQIVAAAVGWHPDARCQGLALWVKSNGSKRWVLDYRVNGRQRRLTLGRADTLPADEAVRLARKHRVAIDHGRDPLAEKAAERRATEAAVSLTTFFDRYIVEHAEVEKKPRSIAEDKRLFSYTIQEPLGRIRVPDLTDDDVRRLHRNLKATPVIANRVVALLSKMMNCAEAWGLRPKFSNPCRHVARYPESKKHRFLSSEQLTALGGVLAESEQAPKGSEEHEPPAMIAAIRLALFCGMRRSEVLNLRWADVNVEAGVIDLPDSKTGRKVIVLNAPAMQVLDGLPRKGEYVFPGRNPEKPLVGLPHAWLRIRKRAGLDGVRLHDLRHSFGSTAAGLGASLPIIGALLGHTVPSTTQRYAGVAQDPRREAAERVGERLAGLLSPSKKSAAVVAMRKGRRRHV